MSAHAPAMMFYVGDWMRDPAVRSVSIGARGLWFDMLCLMHQSPNRGYLEHATGRPVTPEQIARMTGCGQEEVHVLLEELEDSGVCSRTEDGAYYCRRMVRDAEISHARAEAGRRGGSKRASKTQANSQAKTEANVGQIGRQPSKPEANCQANTTANAQAKSKQKPPLSFSYSSSISNPSIREGASRALRARETAPDPALPGTDESGNQENLPEPAHPGPEPVPALPERQSFRGKEKRPLRDPAKPPSGVAAAEWAEACAAADFLEDASVDMPLEEPEGERRALALYYFSEQTGMEWEEIHRVIVNLVARYQSDPALERILTGLRRYPDGALPNNGPDGKGPSRLLFAKRILNERGWLRAPPLAADSRRCGTFSLPEVRI